MRINNRFIYGIISILLAAVIAFVAIPVVTKKTSSTLEIVRVVNPLERGQQITAQDLELIEVGSYNLPASVAIRSGRCDRYLCRRFPHARRLYPAK